MSEKPSFLPFKIPELKSRNMRIGREGFLQRSFSVVPDDFFRIYQYENLLLEVAFQQEQSRAKVFLYTNIDCQK